MARQVIFLREAAEYLEEVSLVLYDLQYFGFKDTCKEYIDRISNYAYRYVGILPGKPAPAHFNRYGKNMRYITYHSNKQTSWYIFYQHHNNQYIVRHITNNHVAAHYMDSD